MVELWTLSPGPQEDTPCFQAGFDIYVARKYILHWIVSLFGIFGNSLVIHVYSRKRPQAIGEVPVLVLSFVDLTMSCFSIIFTLLKAILKPNARDYNCFVGLCVVGNMAFDITYTYSCGMMCLMAVNRFLAVCRAHTYPILFSVRRQIAFYSLLLLGAVSTCGFGIWNCVSVPHNHVAKMAWVTQRMTLLITTALFMTLCYSKVISRMHELKEKVQIYSFFCQNLILVFRRLPGTKEFVNLLRSWKILARFWQRFLVRFLARSSKILQDVLVRYLIRSCKINKLLSPGL